MHAPTAPQTQYMLRPDARRRMSQTLGVVQPPDTHRELKRVALFKTTVRTHPRRVLIHTMPAEIDLARYATSDGTCGLARLHIDVGAPWTDLHATATVVLRMVFLDDSKFQFHIFG